jgi:predicted metalloprotease with PDZ domain
MNAAMIHSLAAACRTLAAVFFAHCVCVQAGEIPPALLAELDSEDFRTREDAQAKLVDWAGKDPSLAIDLLYEQYINGTEPEVRERCMAALKELVWAEHSKEGEGFIGIRMLEETVMVPGDSEVRACVRVSLVMPKSPAENANMQVNDLIVALEGKIWRHIPMIIPFSDEIRKYKPGTTINLSILRDGKLIDVPVLLTRRPLHADNPMLGEHQLDLEAAEAAAREAFFRRWLETKRNAD